MIVGNHYFKTTDSIVHGEIFSWFSLTRGSIEKFTSCSPRKTADLHLNGDIVFPNAQYLEGIYCQGFFVRVTQIVLGTFPSPPFYRALVISITFFFLCGFLMFVPRSSN